MKTYKSIQELNVEGYDVDNQNDVREIQNLIASGIEFEVKTVEGNLMVVKDDNGFEKFVCYANELASVSNAYATKIITTVVDGLNFQKVLSEIELGFDDNVTPKDLQSLIEHYQDVVEANADMKERENEANEKIYREQIYNKLKSMQIISSERNSESNNNYAIEYYFAREHMFPTLDAILLRKKDEVIDWLFNPENEKYLELVQDAEVEDVNWLEVILFEEGITQYRFAQNCGLDRSLINRIINNNTPIGSIQLNTAYAFSKGLGLSLIDFIEKYYTK